MLIKRIEKGLIVMFIIAIGLIGYQLVKVANNTTGVTSREFFKYIKTFESLRSYVEVETPISFGNLSGNVVGTCYKTLIGNYIKIDRKYWKYASDLQREALILHELGHCHSDLEHNNEEFPDGCHKSIMAASMNSPYCLRARHKYYLKELGDQI